MQVAYGDRPIWVMSLQLVLLSREAITFPFLMPHWWLQNSSWFPPSVALGWRDWQNHYRLRWLQNLWPIIRSCGGSWPLPHIGISVLAHDEWDWCWGICPPGRFAFLPKLSYIMYKQLRKSLDNAQPHWWGPSSKGAGGTIKGKLN